LRIAIAEPDPTAADLLVFVAQRRGHQSAAVPEPKRLLERLPFDPAAVIASLGALSAEAVALVAQIRERFPEAVIMVLADRSTELPALSALKAGANDVLRGRFDPHELLFRTELWAAARARPAARAGGIRIGDLEIDLDVYAATKNGRPLTLTKLERRLLYCLCQHYPNIAPIDRLLVFGWESTDDPDNALLKTHISHIRRKLRDAGGVPFEIVSQQTIGYAIRHEAPREQAS
jgi:DNA-binding response OmpR family regulator